MAGIVTKGGNKSTNRVGATVSRRLRQADINVSPAARRHAHRGIFVSGFMDSASVLVDTGLNGRNARTAKLIAETVSTWPQAADVSVTDGHDGSQWVRFTYKG